MVVILAVTSVLVLMVVFLTSKPLIYIAALPLLLACKLYNVIVCIEKFHVFQTEE